MSDTDTTKVSPAQAQRDYIAALSAVDRRGMTHVVSGLLARHGTGDDDSAIALARRLVREDLIEHGDTTQVAAAKVADLENAYHTWLTVSEDQPEDKATDADTDIDIDGMV